MRRHSIEVHVQDLAQILLRSYDLAIFESFERSYLRRVRVAQGGTSTWAVDLRIPLSHGDILAPIANEIAAGLRRAGMDQVAGAGYGAFPLVGAVVAASGDLTGGVVRTATKGYGFNERVEGDLDPQRPVALVDDLLGTGQSALQAAEVLRHCGLHVVELHTVFAFAARGGPGRLGRAGISHRCLATLHPEADYQVPRELIG
jgi:orotate phosphoribosyltransferase